MKILVVLGGGGHTVQMLQLVSMLGQKFEYSYMISKEDSLSEKKIEIPGEVFYAPRARNYGDNVFTSVWKVLKLFAESSKILRESKPKAILSMGPGIAVPISILGKMQRKKIIFVETISRVNSPSGTGKIMYRFADLFFVQWPELEKALPKAKYAGRIF